MKIFHLSDLHIGLKLYEHDLSEDHNYVFDQVIDYAVKEKPEAIVIAGDIYDKSIPSADAVSLFDSFISRLNEAVPDTEIMMISGNHDNAQRVNQFRTILQRQKLHMIGLPPQRPDEYIEKVVLNDSSGPVNFFLLPFVKPSMVRAITGSDENGNSLSYNEAVHRLIEREIIDEKVRNVLVSHQFYLPSGSRTEDVERMDSEVRTVGNIDEVKADILEKFDYAALGHIHKPMEVGSKFYRYCGTPLACSVSESEQDKGIIMVEMEEKGNIKTSVFPLRPLHKVRVITGLLNDILKQKCDDYVSVVITDENDLDVFDMQDRIREAFPNVLEIRRNSVRSADYSTKYSGERELDVFELCESFLSSLTEDEQSVLRDVINSVQEER